MGEMVIAVTRVSLNPAATEVEPTIVPSVATTSLRVVLAANPPEPDGTRN